MATEFNDATADHKVSTAGNWTAGKPDASDDVTINAAVTSMIIDEAVNCLSFNATGTAGITISGSSQLYLYGNFTLDANVAWTKTGWLYINTSGAVTINTAGIDMSLTVISIYGGTDATLASDLNCNRLFISGNGTSLDTANYNITLSERFGDGGSSGAITLALGTSTINCAMVWFNATTITKSTATETINCTDVNLTDMYFNTATWGTVTITAEPTIANTLTINGAATFNQLNLYHNSDRRDSAFAIGANLVINDSSTWKGGGQGYDDPTYRPLIRSSVIKTQRTITVGAASKTLTFTDVDFQDIKVATTNSPTITGTRVGDCGGNTNVDADATKTVYYDAGTTTDCNWYDTYWATSSGGGDVVPANYPLPQDTAVIDNATWDDTGNTLTVNDGLRIGHINASGLTEANTLALASATYYGDLTLTGAGLTVTSTSDTVTLDARAATTLNINRNGTIGSGSITVNSYGGTVQLDSALTHTGTFTLTRGALDFNGQILTTNTFSSSNSNDRTLQSSAAGGKLMVTGTSGTVINMTSDTGLYIAVPGDE